MMRHLLLFFVFLISNNVSNAETNAISIEVPETVELAMVIAVLNNINTVKHSGAYVNAIHNYFEGHTEHLLFTKLGNDFNLPRLAGNAADFKLDSDANIIEIDHSGSIWGDTKGDLFRANLELIQDFAKVSNFSEFYRQHKALYLKGIRNMHSQTDSRIMTSWLQNNFSARPGPMQIIVSPLIGDLNWTTLLKPQIRMWVAPPAKPRDEHISSYQKVLDSYSIFTELDHSYVNPHTKSILKYVDSGFNDLSHWAKEKSPASDYATPELQFNEYMTWSVYLMYAHEMLDDSDFAKLNSAIVDFMTNQRGFIAFAEFNARALNYFISDKLKAEETMLLMAKWADKRE